MAKKTQQQKPPVSQDTIDACLASAIAEGDIVNFRFLFLSYSPLRNDSSEDITADKYAYLRAADSSSPRYAEALARASAGETRQWVQKQLDKKGPAQLPSDLLLLLGDNAVRLGKYTAAAQAYELLRIRRRMQEEFFVQADAALDRNEIAESVRGYLVGTGLAYDYAAFPEPLPTVPDFHNKALILHAEYPKSIEECVALQPEENHLRTALSYLLLSPEAAARLQSRSLDNLRAFVLELVRQRDPEWDVFVRQYRHACEVMRELGENIERKNLEGGSLADEAAEQQQTRRPEEISETLLGRTIEKGEWWQYMKELAYHHAPAVLFVSRQAISKDLEIVVPRHRSDSVWVRELGLY